MNCPKCNATEIVAMSDDGKHLYCPKCNHAWKKGNENAETGTLDFQGVATAKKVFDVLTGGRDDMSPELRTALETQMTGIIFEQWFEGFKAGQMANIVYVRDYYGNGKARSKSNSTTGQHEEGTSGTGEQVSNGENRSSGEPNSGSSASNQRVRENVGGVNLEYFQHIKVPENIYAEVAEIVEALGNNNILRINYDGRTLQPVIKTGI